MFPLKTSRSRIPASRAWRWCFGTAALLLAISAVAQTTSGQKQPGSPPAAAAGDDSVKTVLNAYVDALGGRDALERLRSRHSEGIVEVGSRERQRRKFQFYWATPNMARGEIKDGDIVLYEGYDGQKGWAEEFFGESKPLGEASIDNLLFYSNPLRYVEALKIYSSVTLEKDAPDANGKTVLRARGEGVTDRLFFDKGTRLLDEVQKERDDSEAAPRRYRLDEYRRVDGILFPFVIHEFIPVPNLDPNAIRIENVVRYKNVKHNLLLPPKLFDAPQG